MPRPRRITSFPYFVGDGASRTFYNCQNPLTSPLYPPNEELLSLFQHMVLPVVGHSEVRTVRLADLDDLNDCDFLKLDVQGAELDVMRGAEHVLSHAVVVHTEIEFIPICRNQPRFGNVDVELRKHGFWFHKFIKPFSRLFQPLMFNNMFSPGSQLGHAEAAVYVRNFTLLDNLDVGKLLRMARILRDVCGSFDLACVVLAAYDRKRSESLLPLPGAAHHEWVIRLAVPGRCWSGPGVQSQFGAAALTGGAVMTSSKNARRGHA